MSALLPKNGNHRNLHGYTTESKEFDNQCEIMRSPEQEAACQKHIKQHLETNREFFCHAKAKHSNYTFWPIS